VALLAGVIGACSNSQQPAAAPPAGALPLPPPRTSSTDPSVAWSERLCRALLPIVPATSALPALDRADPEGSRQRFSAYLRSSIEALDSALTGLAAAGPAPVDNGPQVDQVLRTVLHQRREALAAGLAELDAVPQGQPETLRSTLRGLASLVIPVDGKALLELAMPLSLRPAAQQAPGCRALGGASGSTFAPPAPAGLR
jgi:hypothetical protein